jgi:hypothetical protein
VKDILVGFEEGNDSRLKTARRSKSGSTWNCKPTGRAMTLTINNEQHENAAVHHPNISGENTMVQASYGNPPMKPLT